MGWNGIESSYPVIRTTAEEFRRKKEKEVKQKTKEFIKNIVDSAVKKAEEEIKEKEKTHDFVRGLLDTVVSRVEEKVKEKEETTSFITGLICSVVSSSEKKSKESEDTRNFIKGLVDNVVNVTDKKIKEKEETTHFMRGLVGDIVEKADKEIRKITRTDERCTIHSEYLQSQFLQRDEGEDSMGDNWREDEEPVPCEIDSLAVEAVPKKEPPVFIATLLEIPVLMTTLHETLVTEKNVDNTVTDPAAEQIDMRGKLKQWEMEFRRSYFLAENVKSRDKTKVLKKEVIVLSTDENMHKKEKQSFLQRLFRRSNRKSENPYFSGRFSLFSCCIGH